MDIVRSRYMALGGPVEVLLKPGVDHHPHSLDNPAPVVDFVLRHQPAYKALLANPNMDIVRMPNPPFHSEQIIQNIS